MAGHASQNDAVVRRETTGRGAYPDDTDVRRNIGERIAADSHALAAHR